MKALSIRQPWAWLIVAGHKNIENRSWRTAYRGRILVHASGRCEPIGPIQQSITQAGLKIRIPEKLPLGAIVGAVDIVDCIDDSDSVWFSGPYGLVLANPSELRSPVSCLGKLNVWTVPETIAKAVCAAAR